MTKAEVMKYAKAIQQWCKDSDCETCCFDESQTCCLCNFPIEWNLPKPKPKTFADVFLEKFPKAHLDCYGVPYFCVREVFGKDTVECIFDDEQMVADRRAVCNLCWEKVAPKEYQK